MGSRDVALMQECDSKLVLKRLGELDVQLAVVVGDRESPKQGKEEHP